MIPTRDTESIIYSIEEEDTVPRLLAYAAAELDAEPAEADALVRQAIAEVLQGQHRHSLEREATLFRSLCAVLRSLLAAQREPKDDTSERVS
jgi:hypothetical protein